MWILKACPRCGGDLLRNPWEDFWTCLQCGWLSVPSFPYAPIPAKKRGKAGKPSLPIGCSADFDSGASPGMFGAYDSASRGECSAWLRRARASWPARA